MKIKMTTFFTFPSNWAPVEWNWQGKAEVLGENPVPVPLSITNPTWTDPESNPGHRGGRPATNRLSHGTARRLRYISLMGGVMQTKSTCSPSSALHYWTVSTKLALFVAHACIVPDINAYITRYDFIVTSLQLKPSCRRRTTLVSKCPSSLTNIIRTYTVRNACAEIVVSSCGRISGMEGEIHSKTHFVLQCALPSWPIWTILVRL
jgi:hypothetical protein